MLLADTSMANQPLNLNQIAESGTRFIRVIVKAYLRHIELGAFCRFKSQTLDYALRVITDIFIGALDQFSKPWYFAQQLYPQRTVPVGRGLAAPGRNGTHRNPPNNVQDFDGKLFARVV